MLPSTPAQFFGASVVPNSGIALADPLFGVAGAIAIQGSVFDKSGNLVTQNTISLGPNQQTSKLLGEACWVLPRPSVGLPGRLRLVQVRPDVSRHGVPF